MPKNVQVEWRQGETGLGSVYKFNPNPMLTREEPALKQAEFDIPLADGVVVQNLGRAKRFIQITGILYAKSNIFEDLEEQRRNLINGIGRKVGQLHIVSKTNIVNPKHITYIGQITQEGIVFDSQENSLFLGYTMTINCADPDEYGSATTKLINSDTKVV